MVDVCKCTSLKRNDTQFFYVVSHTRMVFYITQDKTLSGSSLLMRRIQTRFTYMFDKAGTYFTPEFIHDKCNVCILCIICIEKGPNARCNICVSACVHRSIKKDFAIHNTDGVRKQQKHFYVKQLICMQFSVFRQLHIHNYLLVCGISSHSYYI